MIITHFGGESVIYGEYNEFWGEHHSFWGEHHSFWGRITHFLEPVTHSGASITYFAEESHIFGELNSFLGEHHLGVGAPFWGCHVGNASFIVGSAHVGAHFWGTNTYFWGSITYFLGGASLLEAETLLTPRHPAAALGQFPHFGGRFAYLRAVLPILGVLFPHFGASPLAGRSHQ